MASLATKLITGDGRTINVGEIAQCYRDIVNLSVPSGGRIQKLSDNVYSLTNQFTTVDCDTLEKLKTQKVYSLTTKPIGENNRCIDVVRGLSDAFEVSELALVTSENGRFTARLKSPSSNNSDGPKKQLLEIWDRLRLLKTIDISDLETHGSINTDSTFANLVWTTANDQDKLLYVCQRKRPKTLTYFKETKSAKDDESGDKSIRGEEFIKREDWGECLTGVEHTMIAVLDVSNNFQITTVDLADHSLGKPQWFDNGNKIVCEAYVENPRQLGIVYCNRQPCKLVIYDWRSDLKDPVAELGSPSESFHTHRVSNSGDKFVFLSNPTYGAHAHSVELCYYDTKIKQHKPLPVDLCGVDLFIDDLPQNCFTADDDHIIFISKDHLNLHMYLYTFETNKVTEIKFPNAGMSILDFRYNIILASGSDIDATPTLFVATINSTDTSDVVAWHQMEDCIHLEDIEYELYKIPTQDKSSFISAILTKPNLKAIQANLNEKTEQAREKLISSCGQLPTVVIVHGGPHSSATASFMPQAVFYSRLGLKVMLINYRGSTGVSEEYLRSLCGKVGQLDFGDCLEAIRYFAQNKLIDPSRLIIHGGSHGGLLACFMSCQDEFKFTSAIIRNPVVEPASMYGATDIPDWIQAEILGRQNYDPTLTLGSDEIVKLRESSPMHNIAKAYVPTLMLLGNKDRRVPMFQGERWADLLKANGVEVQCKVYPDGHALARADVSADTIITAAIWILNHLPKK